MRKKEKGLMMRRRKRKDQRDPRGRSERQEIRAGGQPLDVVVSNKQLDQVIGPEGSVQAPRVLRGSTIATFLAAEAKAWPRRKVQ